MNMGGSMRFRTGLIGLALLAVGCSGNPQPGDSGYAYNIQGEYALTIDTEGGTFTGKAVMDTQPGGYVSGTVNLESPEKITGDFEGDLAAKLYTFTLTYLRGECEGVGRGSGEVAAGGEMIVGTMDIGDECETTMIYANFTMKR
jgi:hypothetical protein